MSPNQCWCCGAELSQLVLSIPENLNICEECATEELALETLEEATA